MHSVQKEEKIPLQTQRLMIFMAICRKAQAKPNRIVHLSCPNKLAFGVIYMEETRRYIAYGGVFEYAHTRKEVIEQGIDKLAPDESIMCAVTIKRQAFTKPVRTPFALLKHWNKYLKNRPCTYLGQEITAFFPTDDDLTMDYPAHHFHNRLVAIEGIPLWNDSKYFVPPSYIDNKGRFIPKGYYENRVI